MKIVFPDVIDLLERDRQRIQALGDVTFYEDLPEDEAEVLRRIQGAEAIAPSWIDVTADLLSQVAALRYIVVPAVGYDQVDVAAASAAGIAVINCPTHNALAVAEYTMGLIFAVTRGILTANRNLLSGEWNPRVYKGMEVQGKTLVMIGYGTIGRAVERLATTLGMQVQWATSRTAPEDLDCLIASADILSLHLPLTPQTRHLLDERRLNLMKPSAYLINTARGAIVDQQALLRSLQERRIAGAALDVFENEPVTGKPSAEILALSQLENVVATPHIAYNSHETVVRLGEELVQNLQACIKGNPINVVNRENLNN